ncbi:MAG: L,D-transpeptidase [Actinomycetota bacterium]|nr:L,D-transpeptidase [Actinomycetota bacterium]
MKRLPLPLLALALLVPASASAQEEPKQEAPVQEELLQGTPKEADVRIALKNVNGSRVTVGSRILGVGYVRPFVPDQEVRVWVSKANSEVVAKRSPIRRVKGKDQGRFKIRSPRLIEDGVYRVRAKKEASPNQEGFQAESKKVGIAYPDLDPGMRNNQVNLFNKLLSEQAYYTSNGSSYGGATGRAVLAYRKVNRMPRTQNATPSIFRTLANGKGGFKLEHPGAGKHVEADLSRQVMVLANNGRPKHIFHISSGTAATPTIKGHHTFFRKQYGTNSLGMVHSVYFGPTNRGYATHGYKSVPTYPASHGCLRNPIPNSLFIYNWISIGDDIFVYA